MVGTYDEPARQRIFIVTSYTGKVPMREPVLLVFSTIQSIDSTLYILPPGQADLITIFSPTSGRRGMTLTSSVSVSMPPLGPTVA